MDKVYVSEKLKGLRYENDLSKKYIADLCEVEEIDVYSWESAEVVPPLVSLSVLSRFYRVPMEELLYPKNNKVNLLNIGLMIGNIIFLVFVMMLFAGREGTATLLSIFDNGYSHRNVVYLFMVIVSVFSVFVDIIYITNGIRRLKYYLYTKTLFGIYLFVTTIFLLMSASMAYEITLVTIILIYQIAHAIVLGSMLKRSQNNKLRIKNRIFYKSRFAGILAVIYLVYALFQFILDDPIRDSVFIFINAFVALVLAFVYPALNRNFFASKKNASLYAFIPFGILLLFLTTSFIEFFTFVNLMSFLVLSLLCFVPLFIMNLDILFDVIESRKDRR